MPPLYGSQSYWDERFRRETEAFDWLLPADSLNATVNEAIKQNSTARPRFLHIGCGTSNLSFQLRGLVTDADQVVNVDYSRVAVQQCIEREKAMPLQSDSDRDRDEKGGMMVWKTVDLLSADSIRSERLGDGELFDVVVDKSTSDGISCAEDVEIRLPYLNGGVSIKIPSSPSSASENHHDASDKKMIHPLHLLAVHLAALTKPHTGRWVCLSYTEDRFPFLVANSWRTTADAVVPADVVAAGFPHPQTLWTVERKERIVIPGQEQSGDKDPGGGGAVVYRPETAYWLYVLARTGQGV